MTIGALFRSGMFWIFALLMVMAGASELAMAQWASAFAEGGLKVSKAMGDILGPCFFAVTMGIARVAFAKLAGKIDLMKYMIGCAALCILAYMIAVFAPWPVVSLLGCGLCGFSVGGKLEKRAPPVINRKPKPLVRSVRLFSTYSR